METLAKDHVLEDVALFQEILEERFSYFYLEHGDYEKALGVVRARASTLDRNTLGCLLQKILALFIDGHARMSHVLRASGNLPFLTEAYSENVLALSVDGTSFFDDSYPYLTKLDGKAIDEWITLAQTLFPKSSPQFSKRNAVEVLKRIQHWRLEAGQPLNDTVEVELSDGVKTKTKKLEVLPKYGSRSRRTEQESRFLENNLGYLRLTKMDEAAVETIRQWMPVFKSTDGLIIDVRGNGGGLRTPLRELFPYFMLDDTPVVASLAVYRLWEGFNHDHLAARYMYRFEDEGWSDEERSVIKEVRKTFEPSVKFPKDKFSDWHYLVLSEANNSHAYSYTKPVVVLMDTKCFSATDIFLGSLKGRKNITLIGQASSGGSGFAVRYDLPNSGLSCQVASMLSFQPSGQLYDTVGIQPDIEMLPGLEDFISESDAVLARAIEHIKNQTRL